MEKKNNQLESDIFYKLPKILFTHNAIINTESGELVNLTLSDVFLYSYMLDQFGSYQKSGNKFFESILNIAKKCSHLSESTIKRSLSRLQSAGLIKIGKKEKAGWASNIYTIFSLSELLNNGKIEFPEITEPAVIESVEFPMDVIEDFDSLTVAEPLPTAPAQPEEPKPWGERSLNQNGTLADCVIRWAREQGAVDDQDILKIIRPYLSWISLSELPHIRAVEDLDLPF